MCERLINPIVDAFIINRNQNRICISLRNFMRCRLKGAEENFFANNSARMRMNFLRHSAIDGIITYSASLKDIEAASLSARYENAGHRYLITSARFTARFMNDKIISKDKSIGCVNEYAIK